MVLDADQVNTNGVGPNFRVLLAQITTVDDIEYNLNIQLLDGGIGGTALTSCGVNGD